MECMRNNFFEGVLLDGRYKTVCPLNHGSFGMVFKARDVNTGELVALKCLTKASAATAGAPAFAIDDRSEELAIHRHIGNHPNIVNLLHHFETEHHIYLVLEFCQNGDLYEAIRVGRGPGQTEHVRDALLQLVDAVEYMHSKGVFHRDMKPENIFLSSSGAMKIGDFGLATMETTSFESAVGSDRYMAPEQMDPGLTGYSPAQADVWAIGICLLNMLFSRNPFATPTLSDPLFSDFATDRQTLFDVFPNMSQDTFDVLIHCLAIDPEKRSLAAAREAITKAVCFTTEDESLDDFCATSAPLVAASANREPLRTPSISSPQVEAVGAFPWAKALAMTPPVRQLSVIPDNELSDELFPEISEKEWNVESVQPDNASAVSFVDSGLGLSLKSTNLSVPRSKPMPVSGSLPIAMARPGGSMAAIFGRKREFESKSWSDLWDEEEEEQAAQSENESDDNLFFHGQPFPALGNDSSGSDTPRAGLTEAKDPSAVHNARNRVPETQSSVDTRVSQHTGFLFEDEHQDSLSVKHPISPLTSKYSPPSKRSAQDKWAALGDRRRGNPFETKEESAVISITEITPSPADIAARKRGRAGSWRKNLNWGVWGQAHQKGVATTTTTTTTTATTITGTETSLVTPEPKKDWMANNWRKQESKLPEQVQNDAGRSAGRPFEWVWRM